MRRLTRFRNWLGYVYSVCWAFHQQFAVYSSPAEQRKAEGDHSAEVDAPLAESGPTVAAERSGPQSGAVESSIASAPAPVEAAQVESARPIELTTHKPATLPIEQLAAKPVTPPEKIPQEPTVNEKERVAPMAKPKKVFTPAPKVATVPKRLPQPRGSEQVALQPTVSAPRVAGSSETPAAPALQAPQASPANVNAQVPVGATESPSALGKYEPGTVNDQTAQRLARLLVSEIKLYHKSKAEGENGNELVNIYDMLKDPIDKSRQHYQLRMGEKAIKTMPDYFHGELVRSLCGGDPSRLGPNYQTSVERT